MKNNRKDKMKLTDSYIKKLKHLDKDQWISHDGVTGLVLAVYKYPSTSKTFFYQYRPKGKDPVRIKIGSYEELGIQRAIKRAQKISNDIFEGKDPHQTRQKFLGEATLGEQLKESYKSILTTTRYSASTIQGIKSILGTYVLRKTNNPEIRALFNQLDNIQHQRLSSISNNRIIKFHQIIGSRTPRQANSFVEYLRMLFNIWIERGITNNQPCKIKKRDKFEEKEYLDFLRPDEIRRVENVIFQKDQKTGRFLQSHYTKNKLSLVACALIAYQLYSSRRTRSEASKLKWDQVIFGEEPIIRLEKTKTSKRNNILEFAMGDEELEVIRTIQRDRTNNPKSKFYYPPEDKRFDYVFPSAAYDGKKRKTPYLVDVDKTWKKVLGLAGIKRHLKHYALRHTHATQLLRSTGNLKLVADTLGITIKQASKYAKTMHSDVIEGKNKAFRKDSEPTKLKEII